MPAQIKRFKGLNNVSDPLRLGLGWLERADNVDITDTGALVKRAGYARTYTGALTSAYSTLDFTRLYVIDGGDLKSMTGSNGSVTLRTGLGAAPMHWTEINNQVFYNNGTQRGIILPDNTLQAWDFPVPDAPAVAAVTGSLPAGQYRVRCSFVLADGRETGSSDDATITLADGQALRISAIPQFGSATRVYIAPANSTVFQLAAVTTALALVWNSSPDDLGIDSLSDRRMDPLPLGTSVVQAWRGRIYAAQYFPELDQSAVWFSQPLGFHLFDLHQDFFLVPGQVLMLAPTEGALIVGTEARISAYDGEKHTPLAPYGVVAGRHWAGDDARTLFWTTRGLCAALPFTNLTERQVSVAPGLRAAGVVVQDRGRKRYLVALQQGGDAFNPFP